MLRDFLPAARQLKGKEGGWGEERERERFIQRLQGAAVTAAAATTTEPSTGVQLKQASRCFMHINWFNCGLFFLSLLSSFTFSHLLSLRLVFVSVLPYFCSGICTL